jgi:hypothetical protein
MRRVAVFALVLLQLVFAQCIIGQVPKTPPPLQSSQTQIDQLKKQIAALQSRISDLAADNEKLSTRVLTLEITKDPYKSVALDLTSRAYQRIDTETAAFLISVNDASPYVDGYRVKLSIGNPYCGTYSGFKLNVSWNTAVSKIRQMGWDKWKQNERTKEISYTETLMPGSWTSVDLLLPATTADQLGYLILTMETNTISLHTN